MALGEFIFEDKTAAYQQAQNSMNWRYDKADRFNARPAFQFLGVGDEKHTFSGALFGGDFGKFSSISTLKEMADKGEQYTLLSGLGDVLGEFVITGLDTTGTIFWEDGVPRKIDFTLTIERVE